ncbi:ATP synthase subunit g, mitochondrial [Neolecta irregularis DAH-3]|uniref:ATP synthase subunit g, mitochondrial n=1 Tax=Neolecta irregularis (strain DAH-3) TaxID=1198029 RepID=A0A1U7LQ00_NEOID|nr:ATP synthase subunit g, mitochondrial [Neolecta irregularis DAH-3]|eukprot:OLL24622.1 ATP synthase subunit g, mitochondrial [Neolecta irregularis DAH-3]
MFLQSFRIARVGFRHNSSNSSSQTVSEGLKKASAIGKEVAGKASELGKGLTVKAAEVGKNVASQGMKLAGAAGNKLFGSVGGFQEPTVYYLQVVRELAKQVYLKENMSPPNLAEIRSTWEGIYKSLNKENLLKLKGLLRDRPAAMRYGIYGVELYGIFCLGEMLGRRHIVGYKDH